MKMVYETGSNVMERTQPSLVRGPRATGFVAGPVRWLFDSTAGPDNRFVVRWVFLRLLAAIYFSAFFPLLFQIEGLNGPRGILPAQRFLLAVQGGAGALRFWYAPTLFWLSSGSHMMMAVIWLGLAASVAALFNLWPRLSFFVCFLCFLSFVTAAQAFSSYQSDSMLLEAGFLVLFFAPRGIMPGWGIASPPSRASLFLLQWEWFRIYFESGIVKLLSGDEEWRNFTAMDEYYQNGPLAHLDRMVRGAFAALVSRGHGGSHVGDGACGGLDAVSPQARAAHLLLHRYAVGDRRHSSRPITRF